MPLSNINVDRVLSSSEVRLMLSEEAEEDDREIAQIMKRWTQGLKKGCWRPKEICDEYIDKMIRATVWKEEQAYIFETVGKKTIYKRSLCAKSYGYRCITEISHLTKMPTSSQLEGISISVIEEISDKFFLVSSPIKCLLDAGFILELSVPREFLGL